MASSPLTPSLSRSRERVFGHPLPLAGEDGSASPQGSALLGEGARRAQAGSTLLEVLLAVTIVAAGSALVAANMPPPEPSLAREARTFAARLSTAADEAVISGRPIGVDVDATGYGFRRRDAGEWLPIADDPTLARRAWTSGVSVTVLREGARLDRGRLAGLDESSPRSAFGAPAPAAPVGRFDPTGSATALTLDLRSADGAWRVAVGVDGAVSLTQVGES